MSGGDNEEKAMQRSWRGDGEMSGVVTLNSMVKGGNRPKGGGSKPCSHLGKSSPQTGTACEKALRQNHA